VGLTVVFYGFTVVNDEVTIKLLAHLLLPLHGEWRWCDDKHPLGTTTGDEFLNNDAGFDSLPETDFVPDQVAVIVRVQDP